MAAPTERSSEAEVWFLKTIAFEGQNRKIITQNYNGPCSFIAICNILILMDKIQILPDSRTNVSYEFLSQLVCDFLLNSRPDQDISAALAALPSTQTGMDLNPLFTGATSFRPGGHGSELELFKLVGIDLVHGWLVDPQSSEYDAVSRAEDYDTAAAMLAEVDHLTNGGLLQKDNPIISSVMSETALNTDQRRKINDAIIVRHFLDTTWMQLTYHGLFSLTSLIKPGSLVALFRSSHLSVLYRRADPEDSTIYSLVTDHSFIYEPAVVWERLDDIAYGDPSYVDSEFTKSAMLGGDYAGQIVDPAFHSEIDPADEALALQLQQEEDQMASEEIFRRQQERAANPQQQLVPVQPPSKKKSGLKKKKSDCIIM